MIDVGILYLTSRVYSSVQSNSIYACFWGEPGETSITLEAYNLKNEKVADLGTIYDGTCGALHLWSSFTDLPDGIYVLKGGNAVEYILKTSDPVVLVDKNKLMRIIVFDKQTGFTFEAPPMDFVPHNPDKYVVILYYYDKDKKLGRLVVRSESTYDSGWTKYALLKVRYRFNTLTDMNKFLAQLTSNSEDPSAIAELLGAWVKGNISDDDISPIISVYAVNSMVKTFQGRVVSIDVNKDELTVDVTISIPLGFGWEEFKRALLIVLIATLAGIAGGFLGVALAAYIGASTIGAAILGFGTAGMLGGLAALLAYKSTEQPPSVTILVDNVNKAIQRINNIYNEALNNLSTLYNQGKISDEAYNTIKNDLERLHTASISALEDAKKYIEDAYNSGKEDARKEMVPYIGGAFVAGMLVGYMIGSR